MYVGKKVGLFVFSSVRLPYCDIILLLLSPNHDHRRRHVLPEPVERLLLCTSKQAATKRTRRLAPIERLDVAIPYSSLSGTKPVNFGYHQPWAGLEDNMESSVGA
jgi:hypothetical protein